MAASADIFEYKEPWGGPFGLSVALHIALFGGMLLYGVIFNRKGESWGGTAGGGGDAMSARLVSTIPLPAQQGKNVLANESKGITQSKPKEVIEEPEAIPIADKVTKKNQKQTPSTKEKPREIAETASNEIPFGEGGPVSGPYGVFNTGGAKGGFGFQGGSGDFGSRYSWYVDTVRRKVSENWLKYEIDPGISSAQRVYIYFEIGRNGQPKSVRVEQSSGIPSLDQSAMRALQRIDTFGPLPNDYSGSSVAVEFWFDYKR